MLARSIGEIGVADRHMLKPSLKTRHGLRSQSYFWYQHQRLASFRHDVGNCLQINFCFAAAGHAHE